MTFDEFFAIATGDGSEAYDYQRHLATRWQCAGGGPASQAINAPTASGKTAAVSTAWLWNRCAIGREESHALWPRRLVYCLPMRTLVTQTREEIDHWLDNLKRAHAITPAVAAFTLMGGDIQEDWQLWPERPAILIGTQDQLLSRALNRGYAMTRNRWPMHFGLLNNDCLWVLDEVQLMGPGLATALQLEAFRHEQIDGKKYFGTQRPCACWYMSATANRRMLATREWRSPTGDRRPSDFVFELSAAEKADAESSLGKRRFATKQIQCQPDWNLEDHDAASRILGRHREMVSAISDAAVDIPRRSLVICNTVERARALYARLKSEQGSDNPAIELVLLHSRFRPPDRDAQIARLKTWKTEPGGQLVVATQVIEAGVDISSGVLWTEIAPLPSIVQRLGRLNRAAEFGHGARTAAGWTPLAVVVGLPLPQLKPRANKKERERHERDVARAYLPYDRTQCETAMTSLAQVDDASPAGLELNLQDALDHALKPATYSLLRHELLDFFDTDSNVSLGYTDVSPFIRGNDPETDVYVFWRDWIGNEPPFGFDVQGDEFCQVPIWKVKGKGGLETWWQGFVWRGHDAGWQQVNSENLFPGATLLLPVSAGGYADETGWTGDSHHKPSERHVPPTKPTDEEMLASLNAGWQGIAAHTADVREQARRILEAMAVPLDQPLARAILEAVLWHDYGKNVDRWQQATRELAEAAGLVWPEAKRPIGKFSFSNVPTLLGRTGRELSLAIRELRRAFAPGLRHEVASALALRQHHRRNGRTPDEYDLLAEYLVMSHHGYVRKVLRDELPRDPTRIRSHSDVVRGIAEGIAVSGFHVLEERLPDTNCLSIECRKMGRVEDGSESWTRGVLRLLDEFGPFKIAFYEAILRAADWRASAEPKTDVFPADIASIRAPTAQA